MAYFRICPSCGCALDPGERCDCAEDEKEKAVSVQQHRNGKAKQKVSGTDCFASMITE